MGLNRRDFLKASMALAGSLALPRVSLSYDAKAHASLTELAIKFFREFDQHPDFNNKELTDQIIKGSIEEDQPITNCVQHYYNPDREEGKQGLMLLPLNDGSKNALSRAQQLWQQAVDYYQNQKLPEAYYTLGRVCHLLEDMASPEHVYLVNHAIIKVVTKDNSLLNEEFLKKLGQHLNIEDIDLTKSTYQIGSTYEKQCEELSLEKLVDLDKVEITEKPSLKNYFDSLAKESLDSEITPLIKKHLQLDSQGNGSYLNATFTKEETKTIVSYLAPKAVGLTAGLILSFEKNREKKPVREISKQQFYDLIKKMNKNFSIDCRSGSFKEEGDDLLVEAYKLAKQISYQEIPEILILDQKLNHTNNPIYSNLTNMIKNHKWGKDPWAAAILNNCKLAVCIKNTNDTIVGEPVQIFSSPLLYEKGNQLGYAWVLFELFPQRGTMVVVPNAYGADSPLKLD